MVRGKASRKAQESVKRSVRKSVARASSPADAGAAAIERWTPEQARQWHRRVGWLCGCNYTPRTAVNQLEFWQPDTFDPETIDQELGWAESLGFNSLRVFLHDLVWADDPDGYRRRIDQFLEIAASRGIGVVLVFFDSGWHPFPSPGEQREPEVGVHNSGWVQSPGVRVLRDERLFDRLHDYVVDVVSNFAEDDRVQCWDIWNEPDNQNTASYGPRDLGPEKQKLVMPLLTRAFAWAREAGPTQPLTSGIWLGDWSSDATCRPIEKLQLRLSDVISFHHYGAGDDCERRIVQLRRYGRPLLCTEYMARGSGSTFESVLPVLKRHDVGAYNWGLVQGRTQTHVPWDSWQRPYLEEPSRWFHDIFRDDGEPYGADEVKLIRKLTGAVVREKVPAARPRKAKSASNAGRRRG